MRLMITGASGQVGSDLTRRLARQKEHEWIGLGRTELDITDEQRVEQTIRKFRPQAVIHAAAYTDVDGAERYMEKAYAVNAFAVKSLAAAVNDAGAKLVYISTDYVFDGKKSTPYMEDDETSPLSVYGASKLLGEKFAQRFCERLFIVRTSWIFGGNGNGFVHKIRRRALEGAELYVADDARGTPTYSADLADLLIRLAQTQLYGLYHAANEGVCSRYQFAEAIVRECGIGTERLHPVRSEQFPLAAARPANSALACEAIRRAGLLPLRPWQDALHEFAAHGWGGNI